jgi:hypothetical protein
MPEDRPSRRSFLLLAVALAWPISGCDSGSATESVQVSPEAQKKTEEFLGSYQKRMQDQHKGKMAKKR